MPRHPPPVYGATTLQDRHRAIYLLGNGISQALINLLIYLGAAAIVLTVLDRRRSEAAVPTDAAEAAAMSVPVGATPSVSSRRAACSARVRRHPFADTGRGVPDPRIR